MNETSFVKKTKKNYPLNFTSKVNLSEKNYFGKNNAGL